MRGLAPGEEDVGRRGSWDVAGGRLFPRRSDGPGSFLAFGRRAPYDSHLRQLCLKAPKFGQDDDRADCHAARLLSLVLAEIDDASRSDNGDAVIIFRCLETDMRHIRLGAETGATPDGRHAGQPLRENTSPYPGSCRNGLTAMLKSVAKLPLSGINSGTLNIRLQPELVRGEEGLDRLAALFTHVLRTGWPAESAHRRLCRAIA